MPTLLPYKGLSRDRVVALANLKNNTNHQYGTDFTFGTLRAQSAGGFGNTVLQVLPGDTETYVQQSLEYTRLSLAVMFNLPDGEVLPVTIRKIPFSVHQVLDDINTALGLDLLPEEVEDSVYDKVQERYTLRIAGALASVAWLSSSFDFPALFELEGDYRILEDGTVRLLDNGVPRVLESFT